MLSRGSFQRLSVPRGYSRPQGFETRGVFGTCQVYVQDDVLVARKAERCWETGRYRRPFPSIPSHSRRMIGSGFRSSHDEPIVGQHERQGRDVGSALVVGNFHVVVEDDAVAVVHALPDRIPAGV